MISLKGFIEVELPGCQLIHYGRDKYCGNCQIPNHSEVDGQSFLIDERSGKATCMGKCNLRGADINQIAAILWKCTNTQAAKRLQDEAGKYGPRQLMLGARNKGKEGSPTWNWRPHLKLFPKNKIATLALQRQIPELGIRRAIEIGLLWYLPERWSGSRGRGDKGLGKYEYHRKRIPSWVIA
jgi:hypothetical protein